MTSRACLLGHVPLRDAVNYDGLEETAEVNGETFNELESSSRWVFRSTTQGHVVKDKPENEDWHNSTRENTPHNSPEKKGIQGRAPKQLYVFQRSSMRRLWPTGQVWVGNETTSARPLI